ncbi:hypothetical protein ACJX0J_034399, partial [Zea mays]
MTMQIFFLWRNYYIGWKEKLEDDVSSFFHNCVQPKYMWYLLSVCGLSNKYGVTKLQTILLNYIILLPNIF